MERSLIIPAGSRSGTATIRLPGDVLDDEDERPIKMVIAVRRGAVPGKDLVEGALLDDDPSPTLTIGAGSVMEGSTFLRAPLALSAPSARFLEVTVRADDGTAVFGDDFGVLEDSDQEPTRFFTGSVHPGETQGSVQVPITDDGVAEPVETFGLTIEQGAGVVVGEPGSAVATITDDD